MRATLSLILLMCLGLPALAQVQHATLEGTVTDAAGLALPGATIAIRDPATNQTRVATSDGDGRFLFANLLPSVYEVRVELSGFGPFQKNDVQLSVGQRAHLTVTLQPAALEDTVAVTARPAGLDTWQTAASAVVDTERIEELPVRSRNYLEFVLLTPGVVASQGNGTATTAAMAGSGFSFAGLRPRSNVLTIDGLDNNDEYSGSSRTELSLETVKEFEVVTHGWSAEDGGGSGGAINVVTKSGTNIVHGDTFLFGQSGRLNARPFLEEGGQSNPSLTRYRAGAAFGGPVRADRTFYYVAAEQEHTRGQAAADIDAGVSSGINSALAASPPGSGTNRLTDGFFPIGRNETELSAKVNHQATARQSLVLRLAVTNNHELADAFNTGGLVDASNRGTAGTRDIAGGSSWLAIIGDHATNEVRGQLARRRVDLSTIEQTGAGFVIPGSVEFGRAYGGNSRHDQSYAELGNTAGLALGNHFLRAGADMRGIHLTGSDRDGTGGLYVFRSVDAFVARQPDSFRQFFGDPRVDFNATRYAAFAQDQWTRGSLAIDAGVRFDAEALPALLHVSDRQFQPRLGIAWTPRAGWIVRGGAGVFADRIPLLAIGRALVADGIHGFEQIVDGSAAATLFATSQGTTLPSPLPGVAPSIYTVRRGPLQPSSRQFSIGAEHAFTPDLSASVNYVFARGDHLLRTVNTNLAPTAADPVHPAPFGRLDPLRADVFELQPSASSRYNGVTIAVNRRLANDVEWSAAYTWSHATDDASDFDEQPLDPYAPRDELGPSRFDQRHRLVASALFELDDDEASSSNGWQRWVRHLEIAPILTIDSGLPVNPITGVDDGRNHAWPYNSRPAGYGRNSLRTPAAATLNLRVLKYFPVQPHGKLDLVVEAFNLLNRRNITGIDAVYGSGLSPAAGFRRPTDAAAARQIEFAIDFEF